MLKFITGNANKFKEVQNVLDPLKIEQLNIDLEEIQDVDSRKIIAHKLSQAQKHYKGNIIVEDTSLYFDCLGGKLPGPFIKWFNHFVGNARMLKLVEGMKNNKITLVVILGYSSGNSKSIYFEGKIRGKLVKPKGKGGFGFDPILQPEGSTETFAELKTDQYFHMSARGIAVRKLKKYLLSKANGDKLKKGKSSK
jgi:non-canonical purine NTP pyrophosphatase (RdgB/HAM1 family)